jgi:hypothetical protein
MPMPDEPARRAREIANQNAAFARHNREMFKQGQDRLWANTARLNAGYGKTGQQAGSGPAGSRRGGGFGRLLKLVIFGFIALWIWSALHNASRDGQSGQNAPNPAAERTTGGSAGR